MPGGNKAMFWSVVTLTNRQNRLSLCSSTSSQVTNFLIELDRYRIRPCTRCRIGFIPLSERFHLQTRENCEAYRIGGF